MRTLVCFVLVALFLVYSWKYTVWASSFRHIEKDEQVWCDETQVTPTVTEEPTPTEEVTSTVTLETVVTNTPTPDPEPAPVVAVSSASATDNSAPQCTSTTPIGGVDNFHIWRKNGDAIAQWFPKPNVAPQVHIWYYQKENMANIHALRDRENDGYEDDLHFLGNVNWVFCIQLANGCAAGELKCVVDGATNGWTLFR